MSRWDDALLLGSACTALELIARREVGCRELAELVLARIESVNPALNAVVQVRASDALREAEAADAALDRGERVGPLHGVPVTVKEAFHVAGLRCTWGNPAWREQVSAEDATVVRRLRRSGAVLVGTTNVAGMLGDFAQTRNDVYGVTGNPWDVARTPGGSSGGSAAAVAAGLSFLDYGSDLVGSVRIPAGFCGVYGLRPTAGVVPVTGFAPPGQYAPAGALADVSTVGPLGRAAADVRLALQATAGPEGPAAQAVSWGLPPPRHPRLAEFRVGVVLDDPHAPVTGEVGAVLSNAVDAIAAAGATVLPGWPDGVDPAQSAEVFGFAVGLFFAVAQPGEQEFAPLSAVLAHGQQRAALQAAWVSYFTDVDVFVCPTNFTAAFPHDDRLFDQRNVPTDTGPRPYTDQPFWTAHPAIAGLPALTAPVGQTPAGLPVGAQIIGPRYEDDTPITFAELLADITSGYQAPPLAEEPQP